MLSGAHEGVSFYLHHADPTLPPELNKMSIEVFRLSTVEGETPSKSARKTFEAVVARLSVRYANGRTSEEHDEKNMMDDQTWVEAIGMNITAAVPGLYWLNFFGPPYVDLMGRERLLSAARLRGEACGRWRADCLGCVGRRLADCRLPPARRSDHRPPRKTILFLPT